MLLLQRLQELVILLTDALREHLRSLALATPDHIALVLLETEYLRFLADDAVALPLIVGSSCMDILWDATLSDEPSVGGTAAQVSH